MSKSPGRIMPSSRLRGSGAARTPSAAHSTTPSVGRIGGLGDLPELVGGEAVLLAVQRDAGRRGDLGDVAGHDGRRDWFGSVDTAVTSASCRPGISRTWPT